MPPLIETRWQGEVGSVFPDRSRGRWTLYRGSSRRWLSRAFEGSGPTQLFVHDSMHTERNLGFELRCAWRHLTPGGAILADDVDYSRAFGEFSRAVPTTLAAPHHDGRASSAALKLHRLRDVPTVAAHLASILRAP